MNATAAAKPKAAAPKPASKARKAAAKPATPVKPVKASVKTSAKAAPAVAPVKAEAKPAKIKLVRDSFTMPSDEYAALPALKQRALGFAHPAKKSELLRAGIKLLAGLSDAALLKALKNVPEIKTGRPKSKKSD